MEAFVEGLGYASGIGIVVIVMAYFLLKLLENVEISKETAESFALIVATLTFLWIMAKLSQK